MSGRKDPSAPERFREVAEGMRRMVAKGRPCTPEELTRFDTYGGWMLDAWHDLASTDRYYLGCVPIPKVETREQALAFLDAIVTGYGRRKAFEDTFLPTRVRHVSGRYRD